MKKSDIIPTTKSCPKCGNTRLVLFTVDNYKQCTDCVPHKKIPWYVTGDQKKGYL